MKEVTIAIRKEGAAVYEVVAFVDPVSLKKAGVGEDAFRDEVRNVYSTEILRFTVSESLGTFFEGSKDSRRGEGELKHALYEVRDKALRSLLDSGVRAEVRRIEGGKAQVVSRLTITSTGVIEQQKAEKPSLIGQNE